MGSYGGRCAPPATLEELLLLTDDFLEAPPGLSTRDGSSFLLCLRMFSEPFSLGEGRDGLLCWTLRTPGNSGEVAITQPRVEGRSTSTLGMNTTLLSYSVRVAISRRRYAQSVIIVLHRFSHNPQRHARMTTIATNLFVDFIIAHLPQESIVNEEEINYNYVNQHVPPCRDQPCCFVSFDTRARNL